MTAIYATVAALEASMKVASGSLDVAQANASLAAATALVIAEIGRDIALQTLTEVYDTRPTRSLSAYVMSSGLYTEQGAADPNLVSLFLNNFPVAAVSLVEVRTIGVQPDTWTTITDWDWSAVGELVRTGGLWPAGFRAVRVTYTGGFAEIPADVRNVVLSAAKRDMAVGSDAGVALERIGSYEVQYNAEAPSGLKLTSDECGVLKPYREPMFR